MVSEWDFGFEFAPLADHTGVERLYMEGNTLAEIERLNPQFRAMHLSAVWCLHSCHVIWEDQGFWFSGPWIDPAEGLTSTVHAIAAE